MAMSYERILVRLLVKKHTYFNKQQQQQKSSLIMDHNHKFGIEK